MLFFCIRLVLCIHHYNKKETSLQVLLQKSLGYAFSLTYRELLIFSKSPSGASSIFPSSHNAAIFGSNGR